MITGQAIDVLSRRYPTRNGEWAHCVEFLNIDFLAVNCWPSKRFVVHGHEVKVSRSDWLSELRKPGKSFFSKRHCDFWWLAAAEGVAKMEEVPEGWGFIEISSTRTTVKIKPERLRDTCPRSEINDPMYYARMDFAMMARRYTYARADRDALIDAVDNPDPYLNAAAQRTGRVTSEVKKMVSDQRKRSRQQMREWRERGLG